MQLSAYNCFVVDYPNKDDVLVFNTRSEAFVKITKTLYLALMTLDDHGKYNDEFVRYKDDLRDNGILVNDQIKEASLLDDFFDQLSQGDKNEFNVLFLTTYACNFSCVYCYQGPLQEKSMMSLEIAKQTISWIENELLAKNYKKLTICFYGGEPLLNKDMMFYAIKILDKFCRERNIVLELGMITNGSLLTEETVKELLKYNLTEIRISLDGNRDCHNKRRPFKNGDPSFDVVVDNIKKVSKFIKPTLIGTYDKSTLDGVYGLMDYLEENDLLDKVAQIGFSPLIPRLGAKETPGSVEMADCTQFLDSQGLMMETLKINRELFRRGVPIRTALSINICPMIMENQGAIIDPYGKIYSCTSFLGHQEYAVADVREIGYNQKAKKFQKMKVWEKCPADCKYLPSCQGGCRFFAYTETKDIASVCCKKNFYDAITPELMKLHYDCLAAGA